MMILIKCSNFFIFYKYFWKRKHNVLIPFQLLMTMIFQSFCSYKVLKLSIYKEGAWLVPRVSLVTFPIIMQRLLYAVIISVVEMWVFMNGCNVRHVYALGLCSKIDMKYFFSFTRARAHTLRPSLCTFFLSVETCWWKKFICVNKRRTTASQIFACSCPPFQERSDVYFIGQVTSLAFGLLSSASFIVVISAGKLFFKYPAVSSLVFWACSLVVINLYFGFR